MLPVASNGQAHSYRDRAEITDDRHDFREVFTVDFEDAEARGTAGEGDAFDDAFDGDRGGGGGGGGGGGEGGGRAGIMLLLLLLLLLWLLWYWLDVAARIDGWWGWLLLVIDGALWWKRARRRRGYVSHGLLLCRWRRRRPHARHCDFCY